MTMTLPQMTAFLRGHGIPIETWGIGVSKTLAHLHQEISVGEAVLVSHGHQLLHCTTSACVNILHRREGRLLYLIEDKQVFKDGRVRDRKARTQASVVDKLKPGESPRAGAVRAIQEELCISLDRTEEDQLLVGRPPKIHIGPVPSKSYPGLWSNHTLHLFEWTMPDLFFKPEGYIEEQTDKTTYFVWVRIKER